VKESDGSITNFTMADFLNYAFDLSNFHRGNAINNEDYPFYD
jgi:hypothetical protein